MTNSSVVRDLCREEGRFSAAPGSDTGIARKTRLSHCDGMQSHNKTELLTAGFPPQPHQVIPVVVHGFGLLLPSGLAAVHEFRIITSSLRHLFEAVTSSGQGSPEPLRPFAVASCR